MLYFAYGSNMFTYRLEKRIGKVKVIGPAKLVGYVFEFSKESKDKSLKANVFHTGNDYDIVWGVLFEINNDKKEDLDKFEGLGMGYEIQTVSVEARMDNTLTAYCYVATNRYLGMDNYPYEWYKSLIVAGAKDHDLPLNYILFLNEFKDKEDYDLTRKNTFLQLSKEKSLQS